jgi:hypothetical protein
MTGDHHGREAETATLLVRVMDEVLGTHNSDDRQHGAVRLVASVRHAKAAVGGEEDR